MLEAIIALAAPILILLAVGALSYIPSSFQSMSDAGILLATVVVVALVADLFLLPVLLEKFLPENSGHPKER